MGLVEGVGLWTRVQPEPGRAETLITSVEAAGHVLPLTTDMVCLAEVISQMILCQDDGEPLAGLR